MDLFNILDYKEWYNSYESEKINKLAKNISTFGREKIEENLLNHLFKESNENMDALIIKILIFSKEWGINSLLEYVNGNTNLKLTKYNYNVIGKYMSLEIETSWNIIKNYLKREMSNNCKYIITRYLSYLGKVDTKLLKKCINLKDLKSIYYDIELFNNFKLPKIIDSNYLSNEDEFRYSLEYILNKMGREKIINNNYIEEYENSIKESDIYIERILERVEEESVKKSDYPILSNYGNLYFAEDIIALKKMYYDMVYSTTNKEYEKLWLNRFTNLVYDKILLLGKENYKKLFSTFSGGWYTEFIFRCKILNEATEKKALKIIQELVKNHFKELDEIDKYILENLLRYQNEEAIDIFISQINNELISKRTLSDLSFNFLYGIAERFYGSYENSKIDYSFKRQKKGIFWEEVVGDILPKIYKKESIEKHPIFDNNKIPDYGIVRISPNKYKTLIECKLILGFEELEDTLEKYCNYSEDIKIFCFENSIDEDIKKSDEYINLIRKMPKNLKYEIYDFDSICTMINLEHKKEIKNSITKVTRKNLIIEKIVLSEDINCSLKSKLIMLLNEVWNKSNL